MTESETHFANCSDRVTLGPTLTYEIYENQNFVLGENRNSNSAVFRRVQTAVQNVTPK